jgi:uncharacterized repeat protein (TIGR03803 family)
MLAGLVALVAGFTVPFVGAPASSERLIYNFADWQDGGLPVAGLVAGDRGVMYGATVYGGRGHCVDIYPGCGTVFKLTPVRGGFSESTVYNFRNKGDGRGPIGLVGDRAGALYGTTLFGAPVLFRIAPSGTGYSETTLHRFTGVQNPSGPLVIGPDGSLYGTNVSFSNGQESTYGMVFRFTPSRTGFTEHILYDFRNALAGIDPTAPLLVDTAGVVYGTTSQGGTGTGPECLGGGCGTIFTLTPSATGYTQNVLYNFTGYADGAFPSALTGDGSGTLYGAATLSGGQACYNGGCGTVFAFDRATRTLKVLHQFTRSGVWEPDSPLTFDAKGALYGTTSHNGLQQGNGGVYKLTRTMNGYIESTAHIFKGSPSDGQFPRGGLLLGSPGKPCTARRTGAARVSARYSS